MHSEETKRKISKAHKGKKLSEEHKRKIGIAGTGEKRTLSTRKRISKALMGNKNGAGKRSKEFCEKMSGVLRGKYTGKDTSNWRGGLSFEPYSVDWTKTLRRAIRERDNYICQLCSQYGNSVHHIDYDKKNCNPDNLITLCKSCNAKVNFNRSFWKKYLTN